MERARLNTPLKQALDADGRRQTWLAEQVGVDPRQVWGWVHGINIPGLDYREAIAKALGRSVAHLWPSMAHDGAVSTLPAPADTDCRPDLPEAA